MDRKTNNQGASDAEKATRWWGNPDVDPYTGKDYDEDGNDINN